MKKYQKLTALSIALIFFACEIHAETTTPVFSSLEPSFPESITSCLKGNCATGDWGSFRTKLEDKGIKLGVLSTSEVWTNTTGGLRTGSVYTGIEQLTTLIDFDQLLGWKGGSFYSCWSYLCGNEPSEYLTNNFLVISPIEGFSTLRNTALWFQQEILGDKISLCIGQLVADSEFIISHYGALFANSSFGFPPSIYTSIPNGGPNTPIGAPGARLQVKPIENFSWKAAIFQANVYPQNINNHGFYWNLNPEQGYLYLTEAAYKYNFLLPGQVKTGAWFDSGTFASMSNSNSSSSLWGNYGLYGIIDQMIYRKQNFKKKTSENSKNGTSSSAQLKDPGLGIFGRAAFEPADRNLLSFYCDTGLNYKGLIPTRDKDTFGIALGYGQLSSTLINAQQGSNNYNANGNIAQPIPGTGLGYEMVLETTYVAQITPWLTIQPDLQYIIHPGGAQSLNNALILGIRTTLLF
ncbi:MAG: hypothetical protein A3F67_05265 [Verrucomicrobia bacterium RIFCSPHIGHO2_12_FULL_41_10]|nr:MAG: hypothetical protein A3F67_05265 [Verrucomicrobia bacterium RIFCSPHIGHO2_12_FULL_41_10]HLB34462.1 carbohydrate porin [Chthoniobacterales bacterium]